MELNKRLTSAPVSTVPDRSSGFTVYTDTYGVGLSSVLM